MKFLEKYLNSGSTEQQNKKRLGALLICITAVLLAISLVVLMVASIATAIGNRDTEDDEEETKGTPKNFTTTTLEELAAKSDGSLLLLDDQHTYGGDAPKASEYTLMQQPNRPKYDPTDPKSFVYGCRRADFFALRKDAFEAFNAMTLAFWEESGLKLYVLDAYDIEGGNSAEFATALAVKLCFADENWDNEQSIYGNEDYEWVYQNAYKYGFIQVSNAEGEENLFRYVGPAHAKYINGKNTANKFYGLADYLEDLKATNSNKPISVTAEVTVDEKKTNVSYKIYFVSYEAERIDVPDTSKYEYTVSDNNVDGYIITYSAKTSNN